MEFITLVSGQDFLGFLTNIRGTQLLIIILVVLLLFGSKRLPDVARSLGKSIKEFRKSASKAEKDFKEAMDTTNPERETVVAKAEQKAEAETKKAA